MMESPRPPLDTTPQLYSGLSSKMPPLSARAFVVPASSFKNDEASLQQLAGRHIVDRTQHSTSRKHRTINSAREVSSAESTMGPTSARRTVTKVDLAKWRAEGVDSTIVTMLESPLPTTRVDVTPAINSLFSARGRLNSEQNHPALKVMKPLHCAMQPTDDDPQGNRQQQKRLPMSQRWQNAKDALSKDVKYQKSRIQVEASQCAPGVDSFLTIVDDRQVAQFFQPVADYSRYVAPDLLRMISRGNDLGGIKPCTRQDDKGFATFLSLKEKQECRDYFELYNLAVAGDSGLENMARSSWLRFLRHASILSFKTSRRDRRASDKFLESSMENRVTFAWAAEVFDSASDGCPNSGLGFNQFIHALWIVLKRMYSPDIARDKLFNVHLVCIKEKLISKSDDPDGKIVLRTKPLQRIDSRTGLAVEAGGIYNTEWTTKLTEEQLCEPEVSNLVQEFKRPLQAIFLRYAINAADPPPSACSSKVAPSKLIATATAASRRPSREKDGKSALTSPKSHAGEKPDRTRTCFTQRHSVPTAFAVKETSDAQLLLHTIYGSVKEKVVTWNVYFQFLKEFGFFPAIASWQTAKTHFDDAVYRHSATELPLQGFVEATWRIAFQFLSIYGNMVQANASCRAKCVWILTFLRRTHDNLEGGMADDGSWLLRRKAVFDETPIEDLLLLGAFD